MKLTLLSLACFFFVYAGAQQVNELHYKSVVIKKNKTSIEEGPDITYGKNFVKTQTKPVHGRNPARYIDKKNGLVVMDFEDSRDYLIEELDSVYRIDSELIKDGEKKTINGYNCEKYLMKNTKTFGVTSDISALSITPTSRTVNYDWVIWITNDLAVDESYSKYVSHALFPMVATFTFPGVIVKAELGGTMGNKYYQGHTILESVVTGKEPIEDFVRPWIKHKKPVAILAGGNSNGYALTFEYTSESIKDQFKRMKALVIKVTGFEKPDFKTGLEGIVF